MAMGQLLAIGYWLFSVRYLAVATAAEPISPDLALNWLPQSQWPIASGQ